MRKIISHNGRFHADDVFAVAALQILPEFAKATIVRTRDPKVIASADIVVDVGFVFDAPKGLFDHHQMPRPTAPEGYPYSAFGLIWLYYGDEIAHHLYPEISIHIRAAAIKKMALGFIRAIDLGDNGLDVAHPSDVAIAIEALNSRSPGDDEIQLRQFKRAAEFAEQVISGLLDEAIAIEIDAGEVSASIKVQTNEIDDFGVLVLERNCKLRDLILAHNVKPCEPRIDFVLEPRPDDCWGLTATPVSENSFVSHRLLPENIRGKSPEEIAAASGVNNVVFVHANGFYACGDKDSMLKLAKISVPDPRAHA